MDAGMNDYMLQLPTWKTALKVNKQHQRYTEGHRLLMLFSFSPTTFHWGYCSLRDKNDYVSIFNKLQSDAEQHYWSSCQGCLTVRSRPPELHHFSAINKKDWFVFHTVQSPDWSDSIHSHFLMNLTAAAEMNPHPLTTRSCDCGASTAPHFNVNAQYVFMLLLVCLSILRSSARCMAA